MTTKPASDLPALPEPSFRLRWDDQRGAYSVNKPNIDDTDCYTPAAVRAIQVAAFNAGRAEAGKDAERYQVLKPMFTAANFHHEEFDLGVKGVVLLFLAPDDITVCADLDEVIDSAVAAMSAKEPS